MDCLLELKHFWLTTITDKCYYTMTWYSLRINATCDPTWSFTWISKHCCITPNLSHGDKTRWRPALSTLNALSPTYLSDCISIRVTPRSDIRSYQDKTRLEIPRCRKQIGDRSFRVYGPTLWNKLPQSLRRSPSINVFKHNLKTYMFQ